LKESEFDHCPTNDITRSQQIEVLIDLFETDGLDGVSDLALRCQRQDFAQIIVVAQNEPWQVYSRATNGNSGMSIRSPTKPTDA
jgi:hypothetical protein